MTTALTNGSNGRDPRTGKFLKGNRGGPGNPRAATAARYSNWFRQAVSQDDVTRIARKLVELAEAGDTTAAQIVLNRCCGRPPVDDGDEPPASMTVAIGIALSGLGIERPITVETRDLRLSDRKDVGALPSVSDDDDDV